MSFDPFRPTGAVPPDRVLLRCDHVAALVAHARREAPRECCGLGIGHGDRVERIAPVTNLHPGATRYEADPRELIQHFQQMDERGEDLVVIYHSHPASPPRPSATDRRLAFYPDTPYLIISLADPARPELRAWLIEEAGEREVAVVVEDGG